MKNCKTQQAVTMRTITPKKNLFEFSLKFWAGFFVFSLVFSFGCASKKYSMKTLRSDILPTEETAAKYQIQENWWEIYQDEKLNKLVEQGLTNNIDLKKSALQVNQALYQANALGANLVPTFNASLSSSVSKDLKQTQSEATVSFSGQLGLSYEVDLWQKVKASIDAQKWEYKATQKDLWSSRLTLINNIIDAYFNLSYINMAIDLAEKNLEFSQRLVDISQIKYNQGKVASLEVVQAKQTLLSSREELTQLKYTRETLFKTLRNFLNLRPQQDFSLEPTALDKLPRTQVDLNVPISVLAYRPDLMAVEMRLQSSYNSLLEQRRSWYPTITLNMGINSSSNQIGKIFSFPFGTGSISLNLPFLQWQTLLWQSKKAKVTLQSSVLEFEKVLTSALNEIDGYYKQYTNAQKVLSQGEEKFALNQKVMEYQKLRYEAGKIDFETYLSALSTLRTSQRSLVNNLYEVLKYENMVYKAMGAKFVGKKEQEQNEQEKLQMEVEEMNQKMKTKKPRKK